MNPPSANYQLTPLYIFRIVQISQIIENYVSCSKSSRRGERIMTYKTSRCIICGQFFNSKKEAKDHKDKNHRITNSKIVVGLKAPMYNIDRSEEHTSELQSRQY